VNVTLTDSMSGQSAVITVIGGASTNWMQMSNGSWGLVSTVAGASNDPQTLMLDGQTVRLGNNQYSVWIDEGLGSFNTTLPIIAPIEVMVTPVATPEPGTLALAVCGLSLVAFRVRRLARGSTN
jgi:hypothetical protein